MKKITILFWLLVMVSLSASAQDFKTFRLGFGLGYATGTGEGGGRGFFGVLEPGHRLTDRFLLNFRYEVAGIIRQSVKINATHLEVDGSAIFSYTVNGQYYFSDEKFRPYAGIGCGLFRMAAVKSNSSTLDIVRPASKFAFYPRVGFDYGHFNLNVDYNIVPNTQGEFDNTEFSNSYVGVRIGFFLGGGRN